MAKGQSLQDPYLNALRRERIPVSIYLVNGIKLQGQIESFDQFVILLKNTVNQMVYKVRLKIHLKFQPHFRHLKQATIAHRQKIKLSSCMFSFLKIKTLKICKNSNF